MEQKKTWVVVSFSGGKDSTAMLLRMIELGEHIDEVIWCDTYKEFPAMYRHVERVKRIAEGAGIKFTTLQSEKDFDYYMFDHKVKRRNHNAVQRDGLSWAGPRMRWCTSKLKTDVISKYFRELCATHNVIQCIGIAADEEYRLERASNQRDDHRHPLVEWGWTEADCLEYCYNHGFDWEGLYKLFGRVSCWCCPLQPLAELRKLKEHFPELWEELKAMDKRTWRNFRHDYSVEEIEIKFALEDEFAAQGKSVRNREFFAALRERIGGLTNGGSEMD